MTQTAKQNEESFGALAVLAVSGGLQDAYTYVVRDGVFANAQTGNVVLLSQSLLNGSFADALRYILPLAAFSAGVALTEWIRDRFERNRRFNWKNLILGAEVLLLILVGFLPTSWNPVANALVSLTCAMQVQAFQKIEGFAFASTMCIGNLRSGVESLYGFCKGRDRQNGRKAACYFSVIVLFFAGAGIGCLLAPYLGVRTIWLCGALLLFALCMMFG